MTVLPPPRRRRLWRLAGFALLAMVALATVVAVRFRQVVATGELAKILCERLEEELGMPVTVGSASVRGLTRVTAAQLAMRPPAGEMPIEAQSLSIKFDGWSLLLGTLEPVTFELEGLELNLASAARRLELKRTLERIERQSHRFKPTIHVTLVRAELERGRFTGDRLTLERPRFGARAFRVQGIFEPPGTEPVAIVVRGVSTASPESVSLDLGLRSPWLELHAEGGLAGVSTTPKLRGEVRLDRLDAAVAARLAMPDTSPVRGGQVTGRLTLSGDAYSPAIEGDFSPKELLVVLPVVGISTVKSGWLELGPGQAVCRD
ncbi:MAG: hypothetical protein HYY25_09190, partial [Candidatus Wallbacteria bacterium]|nr:hypothetical protein [Candidatus Wallbacteria bacterium]